MKPRALLIAPCTSYRVDAYASAAARLGIELVLGTDVPAAFERIAIERVKLDLTDPEDAARRAPSGLDAALGTDETSALVAALVAAERGLPGNDPDGIRATRSKRLMRERFAQAGVPGPSVAILEEGLPAESVITPFPCVAKPAMLSGSQGVIRANDASELARAVHRIRALLDKHPSAARGDTDFRALLVESFLDGPEVAVEALANPTGLDPIAIFDKPGYGAGPYFEETIYVTPSRLDEAEQRSILDVTARAAGALGIRHGPIHAELRVTESGPKMLEMAARTMGGRCSSIFDLFGWSLEERVLARALGLPSPTGTERGSETRAPAAAGLMMLPIPKSGVLRRVDGLDAARAVPGIVTIAIEARTGDALRMLPEGASYLGFAFARGATPAEVTSALESAARSLVIDVAPLLS